jgi:wyosine [tRNA(Phe)-imidazoG37] synthetase (radical SAM superfamily)
MPTFLFDKIVFGPVKSRRLGVSLGINLLPVTRKLCNFDCVYCECGLNKDNLNLDGLLPTREEVFVALEAKLMEMLQNSEKPDVITFAGNGEPTMHPAFADIIDDTIKLRDKYFKSASISVLSNATMLHKTKVIEALKKVDQNILKLDSGLQSTIRKMNKPVGNFNIETVIGQLKKFDGKLIVQTMFTRGFVNGEPVDNTTEADLQAWEQALITINPRMVMIYTIDRDTPYDNLKKVSLEELHAIAARITKRGVEVQISG